MSIADSTLDPIFALTMQLLMVQLREMWLLFVSACNPYNIGGEYKSKEILE
jgi:hypothetical protein